MPKDPERASEEADRMRKSGYTEEQIVVALRQAEAGMPVKDVWRKLQVTESTSSPRRR